MTQGGYQVIMSLPIKSKMVAAIRSSAFCYFCIKLSVHLPHPNSEVYQLL